MDNNNTLFLDNHPCDMLERRLLLWRDSNLVLPFWDNQRPLLSEVNSLQQLLVLPFEVGSGNSICN